jgi:hypothetical protein
MTKKGISVLNEVYNRKCSANNSGCEEKMYNGQAIKYNQKVHTNGEE